MGLSGRITDSTNFSISDRELLYVLADLQDGDNDRRVQTAELVRQLGLNHGEAVRSIGCRLGYMGRIGLVEKDTGGIGGRGRWRLTSIGRAFIKGSLTATEEKHLEALAGQPGKMLMTLRRLGAVSRREDDSTLAVGMRRQWRNATGRNT